MDNGKLILTRRSVMKGALVGVGTLAMGGLFACSQDPQQQDGSQDASKDTTPQQKPEQTPATETWTFVDQADYEVSVQVPVKRMVVMQHHSLDMLAQLGAQDSVVGIESKWISNLGEYMRDVFPGIDDLPTPGELSEWNVEQIAALEPDVVIAASQANPDAMQQIRDLGIPVVVVSLRGEGKQEEAQNPRLSDADSAYTEGCQWAIETLGKLTGKEQKAREIWDFCIEGRSIVEEAISEIEDDERIRVFVACPDEQTYGNDKYVGCQLLRAGAINVAAADIQGYKAYTFEMLANWDPEVIIVQDRYSDVYDSIISEAKYAELSAVKNNKVILAPYWTKPWGNPDTDSIALGELWLSHMFYPEKIEASLVQKRAEEFYQNFYGVEFNGHV